MTPREHATLTAALRFWSERNVPASDHDRRRQLAELDLIASGGRRFPALDAEEIDALVVKLDRESGAFPVFVTATPSPVSSPAATSDAEERFLRYAAGDRA